MTFCWQKNVYSIYALNLHLRLWSRHEPVIYNNLQDNNLHVPVEAQSSIHVLNSSCKNPRCLFKSFEHCFRRMSFKLQKFPFNVINHSMSKLMNKKGFFFYTKHLQNLHTYSIKITQIS